MRTRTILFIVFGVGLTCILAGSVFIYAAFRLRDNAEARRKERDAQLDQERLAAINRDREQNRKEAAELLSNPVPPTPGEAKTFGAVFDKLGRALADGDEATASAMFDVDRFSDALNLSAVMRNLPGGNTPANRRSFVNGMRAGFARSLVQNAIFRWEQTDIRRVRWSPDRNEAIVVAYHRAAQLEDRAAKVRWWLVLRPDGWKVYDLEDLDMGLRMSGSAESILTSTFIREFAADPARIRSITMSIREALVAIVIRKSVDEADDLLRPARGVNLPAPLAAVREMLEAMILLERGAPEAALKRLDAAELLQPNIPIFNQVRANVSASAGRYGEALVLIRKYLNEVGPDGDAFTIEGYALEGLDRFPEAIVSYRRALDEHPGMPEALDGLRRVLDDEQKRELAERVAKAPKPLEAYDSLVWQARENNDIASMNVLSAWLQKAHPDDYRAIQEQFQELIDAAKFDEAAAVLRARLKKSDKDDVKRLLVDNYLRAMLGVDRAVKAYDVVPTEHAAAAFRLLADDLNERLSYEPANKAEAIEKTLRGLIAAHRKRLPDDSSLWYHEGSLLLRAKKYADAERVFAEGQTKLPKREKPKNPDPDSSDYDWETDRFRSARVDCLFKMKQGLKAYAEIGPVPETFRQLAFSYLNEKDVKGLEALIAAHRAKSPEDVQIGYWTAESLYCGEKYTDAAGTYQAFLKATDDKAPYRWQAIDRCVRAYLRANEPGKARAAIGEIGTDRVSAGLRAAVELADGRIAQAEAILAGLLDKPGGYVLVYYDDDFARLIQQPQHEALRKKYPDTRNVKPGPIG